MRLNEIINLTDIEEGLKNPKDNPCWKGYHPVGTKKKNGRTVPNCVPESIEENSLNEFSPGDGGNGGNYLKALASAWYNDTYNTGSLQKGIKSQEDVEKILSRGVICPDGVTRKFYIDYNSDFDGVDLVSHDYYEYDDGEVDSRTGKPWSKWDHIEWHDNDLDESVKEGLDRVDSFTRKVLNRMQDDSWLSAERAYFIQKGAEQKMHTNRDTYNQEIQRFIDLYRQYKGQIGVAEGYGRYWCSTDKKWKERQGPKQHRKTKESVNEGMKSVKEGEPGIRRVSRKRVDDSTEVRYHVIDSDGVTRKTFDDLKFAKEWFNAHKFELSDD